MDITPTTIFIVFYNGNIHSSNGRLVTTRLDNAMRLVKAKVVSIEEIDPSHICSCVSVEELKNVLISYPELILDLDDKHTANKFNCAGCGKFIERFICVVRLHYPGNLPDDDIIKGGVTYIDLSKVHLDEGVVV